MQVTHQKFVPSSNIDGRTIEFLLDRYDAANVILIQDTFVEVTCVITKSDGVTLPDVGKKVAPINNIAHSLFESVRLTINDIPISLSPNNYGYKAYINNVLTYSQIIKDTQLSQQGWYSDLSSHMDSDNNNSGFNQRNTIFRKNFKTNGVYRPEGATFFARLLHDLGYYSHSYLKLFC